MVSDFALQRPEGAPPGKEVIMLRLVPVACLVMVLGCSRPAAPKPKPPARKAKEFLEGASHPKDMIDTREVYKERLAEGEARRALQMFQAREGRNPKDLAEFKAKADPKLTTLPRGRKYLYDAAAGTIKVE